MKNKKMLHLALVSVVCVAIVLVGTFAWYSFAQSAINIFEGFTNPDVNLHDDFDEPNKDVYVENSGQRPLYVRVRLDEYMEIGGTKITTGTGTKNSAADWHTHMYNGVPYICEEDTHDYYDWIMGNQVVDIAGTPTVLDPNSGRKYYLPAPFSHRALFDKDGNQMREPSVIAYDWSINVADNVNKEVRYGTDNTYTAFESPKQAYDRINAILEDDYTGVAIDPDTGVEFVTNAGYLDYLYALLDAAPSNGRAAIQAQIDTFLLDNNLGYWDEVFSVFDTTDASETTYTFDEAHLDPDSAVIKFVPIKRTLQTVKVYTMAQWIAAGTPTGDFWIVDTDGWCYWGEILLPGQATGLLLSEVLLNELNAPTDVWYYGINVVLEAVTESDLAKFTDTGVEPADERRTVSEEGQMVLMAVSGKYAFDMKAGEIGPSDPVYTFNNYQDNVYQLVSTDGVRNPYAPLFVYTGDVPPTAKGDIYKGVPGTASTGSGPVRYGDSAYAVGKSFRKDIPFGTNNVSFTVANAGDVVKVGATPYGDSYNSGVVESPDGNHYIKLSYTDGGEQRTAWLAVGASKKFEPLTFNAGSYYSDALNVLLWTANNEIPDKTAPSGTPGYPSTQPVDTSVKVAIGDELTFNATEWIVLSSPKSGDNAGKTLLITKEAVGANVAAATIATTLSSVTTTQLDTINGGSVTVKLLTIQDAIDCFANNAARIFTNAGVAERWWIEDGIVGTNGALSGRPEASEEAAVRAAVWVDSDKLVDFLNE